MNLLEIDLHDSQLLGISFDPVERIVDFRLNYYPSEESSERIHATIRFKSVSQFHQMAARYYGLE